MAYVLGVDLGTTYTGVALGRDGHVEMLPLGDRSLVAPATVFARDGVPLLTGEVAARRALEQPERSAREYKRRLGDPTPLLLGGAPYSPAILMAAVLRTVVDKAIEVNGGPPARIALTRPAVWGPYRVEQFEQVPGLSGLTDVTMVTEPVAAATYYAATSGRRDEEVIAVYDLGGGTFDATVVRLRGGDVEVLGEPEGVEWLGGVDFDEAVLAHLDHELGGAITALDVGDSRASSALLRLRQECTLAKEALSLESDVTVRVVLPGGEADVVLTRAAFEERIRPALRSTVEAVQRVLNSAGVRAEDVSAILLVGGSSRIPLVSRMLADAFDRPIVVDTHPKHAVALGAAMIAARSPALSEAAPASSTAPASRRGRRPGRVLVGLVATAAVVTLGVLTGLYVLGNDEAGSRDTSAAATTPPALPTASSPPTSTAPAASEPAGPEPVTLPPVNGEFDYQIGGAYPPSRSARIIARDMADKPVPGRYNICSFNAFQTQSEEASSWRSLRRDLLLKDRDGKYLVDPDWPGEYLLDTSTAANRSAIAEIVNGWTNVCAGKGFQAVDAANLDSWTRSKGLLSRADNVAMATLLATYAHSIGMAIGQHNAPELAGIGKETIKFDFAIAEECAFYQECGAYLRAYGDHVIEIEYTDQARRAYRTACANQGKEISVILRDRDVVPRSEPNYYAEHC